MNPYDTSFAYYMKKQKLVKQESNYRSYQRTYSNGIIPKKIAIKKHRIVSSIME